MLKKIISIMIWIILTLPTVALANDAFESDKSYELISNASKTVLGVLSWFGYAIAFGILIWIGIKYMLSAANEKANLKGSVKMYLIGVCMIFLCSTIAKSVADIASSVGDNTAGGLVDTGFELGGLEVGNTVVEPNDEDLGDIIIYTYADGNIKLHAPARIEIVYKKAKPPTLTAPQKVRERKFMYWIVREKRPNGEKIGEDYKHFGTTVELSGAYNGKWTAATRKYELWVVYEGDEERVELAKFEQDLIDYRNNYNDVYGNSSSDIELPPEKLEGIKDRNKELYETILDLINNGKDNSSKLSGDNDPFNIYGDEENPEIKDDGEKDKNEKPAEVYRPTPEDLAGIE